MKCFMCGKDVNKRDANHIYRCAKKNGLYVSNDDTRFKQVCFDAKVQFTKEMVWEEYVNKQFSLPDFENKHNLCYSQTLFLLAYFGIKQRNIKESSNLQRRKEKYKGTCMDKYNCDNVSKCNDVKEKKKKTFLKNYGVDNIWKSHDYYRWLHEHMEKTYGKKSLPNKYGKMQDFWDAKDEKFKREHMDPALKAYAEFWEGLTDEQKTEIIQKRIRNGFLSPKYDSKIETKFGVLLNELCLSYHKQFWINQKSYDFRISNTKIIIEIQGDYWHANPCKYKAEDLINYPDGKKLAKEIWNKDLIKKENALKYGYRVVYFWEHEINTLSDEEMKKEIIERIKNESL